MLCLSCRRLTPPGPTCRSCGAPLPERPEPPVQTAPLDELRAWTLELRSGDIDGPEFLRRLEAREARLRQVLADLDGLEVPEEMQAEVHDELLEGRRAIQGFLEALEVLREWEATGRREVLDQAMALATQANARINEAARMNWRTFRTYQEAAEEFLGQVGYDGP